VIDRRRVAYLVGESVREVGILVSVFGPLDALLLPPPVNPVALGLGIGGGLILITLGIIVEAQA